MPIVYVVSDDFNYPAGGIKKLYELVDTLNKHHIQSFIIHNEKNFRATWFENKTKVIDIASAKVTYDDIIIFPEVFGEDIKNYWPGVRKIIFSQNSFYALQVFYGKIKKMKEVYLDKDVINIIVVSQYDFDFFAWLFPGIKISKITCGIDERLFFFNPNKLKTITVMPRKSEADFIFLKNLMRIHDSFNDFKIVEIDNMPYEQCAETIRNSSIFLSFSHQEGFGLPPAEAMACGCIVIGYHGYGGKEYFKEGLTYTIDSWDMRKYATILAEIIKGFGTNPEVLQQIRKDASKYILENYSMAKQEKSMVQIIKTHINLDHNNYL